jgi:hypothetical protein
MKAYVVNVTYANPFQSTEVVGVFSNKKRAQDAANNWTSIQFEIKSTFPRWNDDRIVSDDWTVEIVEKDYVDDGLFFTYRQNNSGGSWEINDKVTLYVIIEAQTAEEADERAEKIGIEFETGCPTCGYGWSRADHWESEKQPMIYDQCVEGGTYRCHFERQSDFPYPAYIYYYDRMVKVRWA